MSSAKRRKYQANQSNAPEKLTKLYRMTSPAIDQPPYSKEEQFTRVNTEDLMINQLSLSPNWGQMCPHQMRDGNLGSIVYSDYEHFCDFSACGQTWIDFMGQLQQEQQGIAFFAETEDY